MLLSQVIRGVAITGRTDAVGEQLLGRQGGRWAHQWIGSAFPDAAGGSPGAPPPVDAAARSRAAPSPADAAASLRALEDLRRRGVVTAEESERLRPPRGGGPAPPLRRAAPPASRPGCRASAARLRSPARRGSP